ncbi:MAG: hypothetical protein V4525_12560 [Pseudomonadota bacterium]
MNRTNTYTFQSNNLFSIDKMLSPSAATHPVIRKKELNTLSDYEDLYLDNDLFLDQMGDIDDEISSLGFDKFNSNRNAFDSEWANYEEDYSTQEISGYTML